MSQFNAPGSGIVNSGDKLIERKVVVSTSGRPSAPGGQGRLTNVSITEEPGGIQRGVFEYTRGGAGDASYNAYGKRIELMGGSREVPIYNHPNFKNLTETQISDVQKAVENKQSTSFNNVAQQKLYECLVRQIEYYLAPSIVARISEIESNLPSTSDLCKVSSPSGLSKPPNTRWVLTGISASPIGEKYEVTREYTSIQDPQAVDFLYS